MDNFVHRECEWQRLICSRCDKKMSVWITPFSLIGNALCSHCAMELLDADSESCEVSIHASAVQHDM